MFLNRVQRWGTSSRLVFFFALLAFTCHGLESAPISWKPLTEQAAKKPLAYFRSPLPWQGLLGDDKMLSAWKAEILNKVIPETVLGKASREILMRVDSSIELLVLPPANRFLPIPSMVISMDMAGGSERQNLLEEWVIATMSQVQGSPVSWLKFKDVSSPKAGRKIREVFLPGGRCWVQIEQKRVTFFYSSDMDFLKSFDMESKDKSVVASGLSRDDFQLNLEPQEAFSFYDGWLKRVAKPMHQAYLASSWSKVKSLEFHSEGEGQSFKLLGSLQWLPSKDSLFAMLPQREKKVELLDGTFRGGFLLPPLSSQVWSDVLPKAMIKRIPSLPILLSLLQDVSFVWSEKDVSPVIKLDTKDSKAFELNLGSVLGPKVARNKEDKWTHLSWGSNRLSYQVEVNAIWFSPLRHALLDMGRKEPLFSGPRPEFWFEYPLVGRLSGNHYSMMYFYLQMTQLKGKGLDPNLYPNFSEQNLKDESWRGMGDFGLKIGEGRMDLRWAQPYGLAGFIAGIELQSSSWVYFLSLIQLTKNSF